RGTLFDRLGHEKATEDRGGKIEWPARTGARAMPAAVVLRKKIQMSRRPVALVLLDVRRGGEGDLAEVVGAGGRLCGLARRREDGQQDRDEDRDDSDHHEELDKGEGAKTAHGSPGAN